METKASAGKASGRSGQAMLEYVIVFVLLLAAVAALVRCFHVAKHVSHKSAILVGSENA